MTRRIRINRALVALLVGVSGLLASFALAPQGSISQALADGGGLASFLGRSPGERDAADLIKTKRAASASGIPGSASPGEPTQRALGKIFDTPPEEAVDALTSTPLFSLPETAPAFPLSDFSSVGPRAPRSAPISLFFPTSSSGGGGGGGGGGGATPPGGNPPVTNIPPVTNAVPEPATWISLLLGMAMTGAALRRRKGTGRRAAESSMR